MLGSRRQKILLGALVTALAGISPPASAEEPGWSDRLLRGTTEGDPSALKTTAVVGLYGLAAASIATGVVYTLRARDAGNKADDFFEARRSQAFCDERASTDCHYYLELRRTESTRYLIGEAFFGGGAFLLLSGALAAELWPNQVRAPKVSGNLGRDHALLGISAEF
jgi:hypothetical protein